MSPRSNAFAHGRFVAILCVVYWLRFVYRLVLGTKKFKLVRNLNSSSSIIGFPGVGRVGNASINPNMFLFRIFWIFIEL